MSDKMEHDFTFKGKPSVEADIKPSKEDLEFIQKVEKKFEKNTAINSEEIVKYFEVTRTQIRSKLLKDVLSIGNVWVRKRDGVYGQGFQNIQETPKDPNRRKRSVQEAFKKAIESAMETTKQLREESVSLSQVKQETGEEEKLAKELTNIQTTNEALADKNAKDAERLISEAQNAVDVSKDANNTNATKPKKKRVPAKNKLAVAPSIENIRKAALTNPIGRGGNANVYDLDETSVLRIPKWSKIDEISDDFKPVEHPLTKLGIEAGQASFENSQGVGILRRQLGEEAGLSMPKHVPLEQRDDIYKNRIKKAASMPQSAYDKLASDVTQLNNAGYRIDPSKSNNLLIDSESQKFNFVDVVEADSKEDIRKDQLESARNNAAEHLLVMLMGNTYASSYTGESLTSDYKQIYDKVMSAIKKQGLGTEMHSSGKYSMNLAGVQDLSDMNSPKKDIVEEARRKKQVREDKIRLQNEAAQKAIEDAINPLTEDIIESISNEAPDIASSNGGGGSRKPPKTAKGSDDGSDDGGDDYEDNFDNEDFNPRRYFKAQVENLQRSFNSKLFGESESTLFSSLQKTFERGSRVEDLNDLEKLIDQETRLQSKILKDFETSNQNTANLLQAKAEEMIVREQGKSEEDRDDNLIKWLNERLDEIKSVREATTTEFNRIQKQIETEIRDNAMKGFESGVIEREMSKEQKILTKFTKEFGKYVNKEHDRLAKERAYETSKAYIEDNPRNLPAEELLKKAQKLYDKEYATYISNAPKEPALTDKEIVKSYEANKETFTPDAFKVKNAPIGFGEKSKYDPTEDDYVSPEKRSLGELIEDPKRRKAIQKNLMVWGAVKGSTAPMVQASNNPTGQGAISNAAGNASTGAFALNALGKAGPYGMLIAASLQTVSILGEIADNTAKNVQAFSPDVMMASVENQLLRLNQNIGIGNERGAKLADYQKSQGTLSRQMYELGVELFSILQPFIVLTVDFINNLLAILNFILMLVGSIVSLIEPVISPMIKFLKESSEGWAALMNWIKGRRNQIPNYTEEFMQNDPRQHIKHI